MSANNDNPFIGEDYCVLNTNILRGTSLLKAVKHAVNSNDAFQGRIALVFQISRVNNKDGGGYLLTELTPSQIRIAETEIRELQAAVDRFNSI